MQPNGTASIATPAGAGGPRCRRSRWRGALAAAFGLLAAGATLPAAGGTLPPAAGAVRAAAASAPEMIFARLGGDDGLAHGAITSIAQDSRGFLWLGTEDGLDRFDGYELRHYSHRQHEADSLPDNWVAALARDRAGRLWVAGAAGGVVWRDDADGRLRLPSTAAGAALIDREAKVRTIYADRRGNLWVGTRDAGVTRIDAALRRSTDFRHSGDDADSLSDNSVFAITEDASGAIWIGTAAGLDRIDPTSGRIERFGARLRAAGGPADGEPKVNALLADAGGSLWIGLDTGLVRYAPGAGKFTAWMHREGVADTFPAGRVNSLLEDADARLWVGTSAGLALFDRRGEKFAIFRHDPTNPSSLPDSNVTSMFQDRSGLLWIGTKTGGAARWNPRSWSFGHHRFGEADADNVTSFAVDRRGRLWVGSFGAGAASIDPVSGAVTRYRRGAGMSLALRDDTVMAMVADSQGRVWLGTMSHGIERVDPVRAEVAHFDHDDADAGSLPAAGVMSLLLDSRGRVWVGTYGGGLARIDPDGRRVVRYPHDRLDDSGLAGDRATALAEDRDGLIWIGTNGSGLDVLDPASGHFAHFVHDPHDPNSLSANSVYALHVDGHGVVWVGTRGGGLDRVRGAPFAKNPLRFDNLSENEGLPNSTVYGIEADLSGKLWVSTNRGLAAVVPASHAVHGFRRSHGLQGDEFNFGAHYRAPDGTLYFGGANGYNAFVPERLQLNERPPPVVITEILKLNKRVSPTPETLGALQLGFRDAVVTFQFAALDFTGPAENRYAYRLEGFDHDWVDAGTARQATYTNLDGGNYVFRVRASNNDGRWSDAPVSLQLHVAPQPWATWWARCLYGATLFAVIYFVWEAQHRRVLREAAYARRLRQEVDVRTEELAQRNRDMERANQQLHAASVTDSLTGLGNRRCLHDAMAALLGPTAHAAEGTAPNRRAERFVLMMVDLDFLKPINDRYGHEAGDAVLLQMAEILRREFRAKDLIVRWGGDEFVVMCRDADLELASVLAERVRSSVAKRLFKLGEGKVARTSCSIGFAPFPFIPNHPQLVDWEHSLSMADIALYEAKHNRNTWVGWVGTEKAAELPSLPAVLAADSAGLERDGFLVVKRRPWNPAETVDQMRAPRAPESA